MKLLDVSKTRFHGKSIDDVVVPPELRVKHRTGIDWMDFVLGGGFTPSTCWMLTGSPGAGKTTAALTVADALSKQGHQVLVNGREEIVYQVKMTCERLGVGGFTFGEDVFVEEVIQHAVKLQKRATLGKRTFLIVDSLQCLDDSQYDTGKRTKNTPVRCAEQLIKWAKDTYGVLIFINQVTKGGVFVGDNVLLHAVDGRIELVFDRDKKSDTYGERLLIKSKDRFGPAVPPMVIEMGIGGKLAQKIVDETEDTDAEEDVAQAAE